MNDARALWALSAGLVVALAATAVPGRASAAECRRVEVAGKGATACRVEPKREKVRLLLNGSDGKPLHTLAAAERLVAAEGKRLVLAMNAGMFHPSYAPVGLLIQDGKVNSPLNQAAGVGNFFLKPNGVFFIGAKGAGAVESTEFSLLKDRIEWASQSGPLLVRAGVIHPKLAPQSTSRLIRNGVGVDGTGRIELVISDDPVSFYEFALLFRDVLHCPDALYFDGTVSSVYVPALGRSLQRAPLGPIIAVVADR
jgi:uncharacterized protein YigE (DUF2233 family)